jgi:RNA polymerase sigma-70 factor (ECF subfamily)
MDENQFMRGAIPCPLCGTNTEAGALGMEHGAARVAVHRLRKRYREVLRAEVGRTLADPMQADTELRALFAAFR